MSSLDPTVAERLVQGDRNRRCGSVRDAIEVGDHTIGSHVETADQGIDDADVRLVRDDPIDVLQAELGGAQSLKRRPFHHGSGVPEDSRPFHLHEVPVLGDRLRACGRSRAAAGHVKEEGLLSVAVEGNAQHPLVAITRLEEGRPGSIPEQNAGLSIGPIGDAGECLGADQKNATMDPSSDQSVGDGETVDEPAAAGLEVEERCGDESESPGDERGRARADHVGEVRCDKQKVDVVRPNAGIVERASAGIDAHVGRDLGLIEHVSGPDAGPLDDPFVGRVDKPLEIEVGQLRGR